MIKCSRKTLCVIGMLLFFFSGVKVLYIAYGMLPELTGSSYAPYLWFIGSLIFFSVLIFPRAIRPNAEYVLAMKEPMPFYHCVRPRSWLVIIFMIALGLSLRYFRLVGAEFIVGFYTGLGLSLVACVRYYISALRRLSSNQSV